MQEDKMRHIWSLLVHRSDSDACADAIFDPDHDRHCAADADADACADAFTDQEGARNKIW